MGGEAGKRARGGRGGGRGGRAHRQGQGLGQGGEGWPRGKQGQKFRQQPVGSNKSACYLMVLQPGGKGLLSDPEGPHWTEMDKGHLPGLFFFFFCLFRAAPKAYGGSQARGQIGATASGLRHSHSNIRPEPHLQPTSQLMATPDP